MNVPSKSFLCRQAVLNAVANYFPNHLRSMSAGATLRSNAWVWEGWPDDCCSVFINTIRDEYRALVAKYGEPNV